LSLERPVCAGANTAAFGSPARHLAAWLGARIAIKQFDETGTMMKPKVMTATTILRIFCAMVFLSVGFSHRAPAAIATDVQSVAYALPDGTFADLCIADQGQKHGTTAADCEACRLAGAVLLPQPSDQSWLVSQFASLGAIAPAESAIRSGHLLDRPRLRGPPLSV
jgi:hypothetical protein